MDLAREALDKTAGDEPMAVNLLAAWVQSDSEVRLALFPLDTVHKRARECVRKALKERQEHGR